MNPYLLGGLALATLAAGFLVTRPSEAEEASPGGAKPPTGGGKGPMHLIKLGSHGPEVAVWRAVLGMTPGDTFDQATEDMTKAWQASHGLAADGMVGHDGWTKAGFTYESKAPSSTPAKHGTDATSAALPDVPHVDSGDSGRTWALSLPDQAHNSERRQAAILAAVKAGFFTFPELTEVRYQKDGHEVEIAVWNDCLAIGHVDAIRVSVSHVTLQLIADYLNLVVGTTRMADEAWKSSKQIEPQALGASSAMDSVAAMIHHSDNVTMVRNKIGASAGVLAKPNGKDWVTTERLRVSAAHAAMTGLPQGAPSPICDTKGVPIKDGPIASANYGWHTPIGQLWNPPETIRVHQSIGLRHEDTYSDYSQTGTLYSPWCEIDGVRMLVTAALQSPEYAYLLSDEVTKGQACTVWRHPAVPEG